MRDGSFYVATDFARKEEARAAADRLEALGFTCRARWCTSQPVHKEGGLGGELAGDDAANALAVALEDLQDIRSAAIFVQLTSGEKARGGRHVELGYALALGRTVVAVGPREHAFHYHPDVHSLPDEDALAAWAKGYKAGAGS